MQDFRVQGFARVRFEGFGKFWGLGFQGVGFRVLGLRFRISYTPSSMNR